VMGLLASFDLLRRLLRWRKADHATKVE
jgi:hypothetical protein